jgi:magnesium chelatase family protein
MHITVGRVKYNEIMDMKEGESSKSIRKRIKECRGVQEDRYKKEKIYFNAHLDSKKINKYCRIGEESKILLNKAMDKFGFSARAVNRILKMARTISDLDGIREIEYQHVAEAIQYRTLDRKLWLTK